ncbi:MAG TPA: M48 family metallopeptidase [Xanthobacteraceae bacterium]|nr:M48 family metallopeptidase [Xanthobacteraceae bacterium]
MLTGTPAFASAFVVPRGPGLFFDGKSSARIDVWVEITETGLRILSVDRSVLGEWPFEVLRRQSAPEGVLRLGRSDDTVLARLELRDQALIDAVEERADALDRTGATERAVRRKVVLLSFAAMASLMVSGIFGLPVLADRVIPLIPLSAEVKLGNAVDKQIRSALDTRHLGQAFQCGQAADETAGRDALARLVGRLETAAALPLSLRIEVVRRREPNAFALPGGRVYVYEGLIDEAQSPDELGGVLAHEIGHVARRDGTRTVLQTAGLSFLFGMMLGDFVGGGAVVIAAKTVLRSSYSRRVEGAADAYSVALMSKAGGDPRALGVILARIVTDDDEGIKILSDHPDTKDRINAINAAEAPAGTTPLLDAADWSALKQICGPLPAGRLPGNGPPMKVQGHGATPHP